MKKFLKWMSIVLFLLILIGGVLVYQYGPTVGAQYGNPIYLLPPSPKRYGEIAIEILDQNGYYTTDKKWIQHKEEALEELETISSYNESHDIIEQAVKVAGGKHSMFMSKRLDTNFLSQKQTMPVIEIQDNILYLHLPSIVNAQKYGQQYAEIVLEALQNNKDIGGIIVDLQDNTGGDMGPMVTAVSPLLPEGEILYFSLHDYDMPVTLEDGLVSGGGTQIATDVPPFKLTVPVAVLTNELTASSGEATLMTLMELNNVKTFGSPSAGFASGNAPFYLYDESVMYLTVAYNKTTSGKMFGDKPIPVDIKTDQPFEEAKSWLESQIK